MYQVHASVGAKLKQTSNTSLIDGVSLRHTLAYMGCGGGGCGAGGCGGGLWESGGWKDAGGRGMGGGRG